MSFNKMNFLRTVTAELTRRKWSQYRLAKESGVPQQTLSRWLAGESNLNSESLAKVLACLGFKITRGHSS